MNVIELTNIQKSYTHDGGATPVLRGVNLKINEGEFVAIMGPSGSGKSTLLHILGFLDSPTDGDYRFLEKKIASYSPLEIAKLRNQEIGFIFQAFNLLRRTTVLENVKLPLLYSSIPESEWDLRARKAVESVGMSHRLDHEPSQLSGGEQQRVAIARALVTNPKVIFADEPTGNLDSKSGKLVMDIIQNLHEKEGITVVLITHETTTAEHAERIIRLRDGVIETDTKVAIRRRAQDSFAK
jgi:ABC-type lipoprotein export system ATPase subunit